MKRAEIIMVAKMLGVKATGKNEEILESIQEVLDSWKEEPKPVPNGMDAPKPLQKGVKLAQDRILKDNRLKGLHPITGEPIYK